MFFGVKKTAAHLFIKFIADISIAQEIILRKDRVAEGILECKSSSRKIISTQVQSRSRDVGMLIFAKCSICGKSWKEWVYLLS